MDGDKFIDLVVESCKRHEGFRQHPYRDTVGKLTVGYGRNLDDVGISQSEAEHLLRRDVDGAVVSARAFGWFGDLRTGARAVVVEMIFNMGLTRFSGFVKMIDALRRGDYGAAADEMLDSKWAGQVHGRAVVLADQMRRCG